MANEPWSLSFMDCESDSGATCTITSAEELRRRPWKAYWPPMSQQLKELWDRTEHMQLLSWCFNPDDPFDRPWRDWARSKEAEKKLRMADNRNQISSNVDKKSEEGSSLMDKASYSDIGLREVNLAVVVKEMLTSDPTNGPSPLPSLNTILNLQLARVSPSFFNYLAPLQIYSHEKPYHSRIPLPDDVKRTNIEVQSYNITIFDIRGKEDLFILERSGFVFLNLPTNISHWTDQVVLSVYLPFMSSWLKGYFNCKRVLIYTYNFRGNTKERNIRQSWRTPFTRAHCDATHRSCKKRVRLQFPDEAEEILNGRVRFVSVWRSIAGEEQDCPLAVCDFRSVSANDLVEVDAVYPHFCDEGYEIKYNPNHAWFYKRGMSKNEVIMFKLDDNSDDEAKFCPHSAFIDPTVSANYARVSIEVKAIVIG